MNFSTDWWSYNVPKWNKFVLPPLADRKELEVLEIGAFEGRSTVWICENMLQNRGSFLTVIDTFQGSPEHEEMGVSTKNLKQKFEENTKNYKDKISLFVGKSQDILKQPGFDQPWYDLIYVDGSHMAQDVLEDATLGFRALKHGGIMVFDDYRWKGGKSEDERPKKGIDAFYKIYSKHIKILDLEYQAIIQKV
jgi:predicted O-methyltransferase YrrM